MSEIYITPCLINQDYLKAYSPIPINFNWEDIRAYANIAEEIWIVPIIGRALYDELINQIQDNNVTDINSTLLIKIYMLEAIAITYEALPFIRSHISEVGITLGKSDNSDSISSNDFTNLLNHLRNQIEVLKDMLKSFLEKHKECYPLYRGNDDECSSCNENDECFNFMLTLWNSQDIASYDNERNIFYYSLYQRMKNRPNADVKLYSNKNKLF